MYLFISDAEVQRIFHLCKFLTEFNKKPQTKSYRKFNKTSVFNYIIQFISQAKDLWVFLNSLYKK